MTNRRQRRAAKAPLPLDKFAQELRKVVDGDPDADPTVRQWWAEYCRETGVQVAISRPDGIETLSLRPLRRGTRR